MLKKCNRCKIERSIEEFHIHKKCIGGRTTICKYCVSKSCKEWQDKNKDKMKEYRKKNSKTHSEKYRENFIKNKYGISSLEYESLLVQQNYQCKICKSQIKNKRLHIDHCHNTGKIRGLLCSNCNTSLGLIKDNIQTLKDMILYLENK